MNVNSRFNCVEVYIGWVAVYTATHPLNTTTLSSPTPWVAVYTATHLVGEEGVVVFRGCADVYTATHSVGEKGGSGM